MMNIIEDFSDIASRLNQIEQEKHTAIMTAPVEANTAEQIESMYGIPFVYTAQACTDSGDTAPCEYVCWSNRPDGSQA